MNFFKGIRSGGTYIFYHEFAPTKSLCAASLSEQSTLWHQRMGHASLHLLHRLEKKNLVRGLPTIKPQDMTSCSECSKGKQTRASFPQKQVISVGPRPSPGWAPPHSPAQSEDLRPHWAATRSGGPSRGPAQQEGICSSVIKAAFSMRNGRTGVMTSGT